MKNLFKEPHSNPIPQFLEIIPYTDSIVDLEMLDTMVLVLAKCGYVGISNSMVMLLLIDMNTAGLVEVSQFSWPSTLGKVYIIKKVLDGKQIT